MGQEDRKKSLLTVELSAGCVHHSHSIVAGGLDETS